MERCFVCRREVEEFDICRRVMPVGSSSGVVFSRYPGWSTFIHSAPVTLCPACDAAEAYRFSQPLSWPKTIVYGALFLLIGSWCVSALVHLFIDLSRWQAWRTIALLVCLLGWGSIRFVQNWRKTKALFRSRDGHRHRPRDAPMGRRQHLETDSTERGNA
jgi:hypothetical protein